MLSPDGKWWWDGAQWVPVTPGSPLPAGNRRAKVPTVVAIIALVLCFPVGAVTVWFTSWSTRAKAATTAVAFALLTVFTVAAATAPKTPSQDGTRTAVAASRPSPSPSAAPTPTKAASASSPTPTAAPSPTPTSAPTARATAAPTAPPTAPPVANTCGAPANPWGYNFCGRGGQITQPPGDFCGYFNCIASFWNGRGFVMECQDATYSKSGGIQGSCSHHGGNLRELYGT
ncbi:MAG: hypothetical protein E6I70_01105 [Chloroflexi bacterium]|nr:MAG: hypothetical protein E6I70_01105 [Chloroflexota bacterium]